MAILFKRLAQPQGQHGRTREKSLANGASAPERDLVDMANRSLPFSLRCCSGTAGSSAAELHYQLSASLHEPTVLLCALKGTFDDS